MNDYTYVFENADKLLEYYNVNAGNRQYFTEGELNKIITDLAMLKQAISQLIADGHITYSGSSENFIFTITGQGTILGRNGYYKEYLNRKRLSDELKSQINQSVEKTNKSVQDTNYWVKRTSIISVGIALITLFYIIKDFYKTKKEVLTLPLQEQERKSLQQLDSIAKYQKEIEATLRKIQEGLPVKPLSNP